MIGAKVSSDFWNIPPVIAPWSRAVRLRLALGLLILYYVCNTVIRGWNMKIRLEVGQPRDFNSGDGTNVIICDTVEGLSGSRTIDTPPTVAARIHMEAGVDKGQEKLMEFWFVAECAPITWEGMQFSSLLFVPRYKTKRDPLEMLQEGDKMVLHVMWREDGKPWDKTSVKAAQEDGIDVGGMMVTSATKAE